MNNSFDVNAIMRDPNSMDPSKIRIFVPIDKPVIFIRELFVCGNTCTVCIYCNPTKTVHSLYTP